MIEINHFLIEARILRKAFPQQVEKLLRQAEIKKTLSFVNIDRLGKEGKYLEKLMEETEAKGRKLNPEKMVVTVIEEFGTWRKMDDALCMMRGETLRRIFQKQ